jgi:flagellar assembly factor FliW
MKLLNKQFGEIEFEKDAVIKFEDGILGFEELNEFLLFSETDGYFFWLISVSEPEIIFPLFSLKLLQEEYSDENKLEPYGIVKLDKEPENISVNLKAPVFINQNEKIGFQKIIDNEELKVDYPLFVNN